MPRVVKDRDEGKKYLQSDCREKEVWCPIYPNVDHSTPERDPVQLGQAEEGTQQCELQSENHAEVAVGNQETVDENVGGSSAGKVPRKAGDAAKLGVGGAPESAQLRNIIL